MSLNNQNGSVTSSVSFSVGIHIAIVGLLLFAPQIKQLPIIKDIINARTSTDMSVESAIGAQEEVTVSYVEPEKNNIKKLNSPKSELEVKKINSENIEKNNVPSVPESRQAKSKVKKLMAKAELKPKTIAPITDKTEEIESNIMKAADAEEQDINDDKFDIEDATKELANNDMPTTNETSLIKNPNPPAEIDHAKDSIANSPVASGNRDARKLKQIAGNPKPTYPSNARLTKEQGTVVLKYLVTNNGAVEDIRILESSGSKELDKEAINKIQRWKFQPGQAGETTHPVTFKLNGPSKQLPSRLRTSKNG